MAVLQLNPTYGTLAEQRWQLLNLRHLPARLTYQEAGWILNFSHDEISILVSHKLLTALGNPPEQARKYLSAEEVLGAGRNVEWLHKASKVVRLHRRAKNDRYMEKDTPKTAIA